VPVVVGDRDLLGRDRRVGLGLTPAGLVVEHEAALARALPREALDLKGAAVTVSAKTGRVRFSSKPKRWAG